MPQGNLQDGLNKAEKNAENAMNPLQVMAYDSGLQARYLQ